MGLAVRLNRAYNLQKVAEKPEGTFLHPTVLEGIGLGLWLSCCE